MSKEISVFQFNDYKLYIRTRIKTEEKSWGLLTRLAEAAGCQRSYLSRVLTAETHLTPSQVYGLSTHWNLSEDENEYFLGLLEIDRAASRDYASYWKRKNERLKRKRENLARLVNRKSAKSNDRDLEYYSSWVWVAVHALTSIPEFQSERALAERLGLPLAQIQLILTKLEAWGSVKREARAWKFEGGEQHLPKNSPLVSLHHNNWRQRAILDAQSRDPESVHYTVVQSLSRADLSRIKQLVLELIEKSSAIAGPSKEEELTCLTCDFFRV